jgi:phytoene dehydrogenase-like protein
MAMTEQADVILIGGGHNGLVCAAYLAKAGRKVLVLEAGEQVGGLAVTREFAPGFKVSGVAHLLHQLNPAVIKDLNLASHGFELGSENLKTIALDSNGQHIGIRAGALGGAVVASDRDAYARLYKRLCRFAKLLSIMLEKKPPLLTGGDVKDMATLAKFGLNLRRMGRDDMREFLRIITINIYDLLNEQLESDLLKGALSFDAVLGTHLGPRSAQSLLTYLYRLSGEVEGISGAIALPKGGMGSVTAALSRAAQAAGAEIRTSTKVTNVIVEGGRAKGVLLEGGRKITGNLVVSNADPKTTFLKLVGARHFEAGFANRIHNMRMRGNAAKLHLALNGLPTFSGLAPEDLNGRLIIAPSLEYVESAFNPAKYGEASQ